jgi:short-subunit dehydrogenase
MAPPRPSRALITGASSGIGRATAHVFAAHGIEVGILSNLQPEVDETVEAIRSLGGRAFPVYADLSQREHVTGLVDRLENEGRALDVLVNNAGIGLQADALDTQEEDLRRLFEVNYFAAVLLGRDCLRWMAKRRRGHIINVSSASARRALPGLAVYASTKAAMHAFSQALRVEAKGYGVAVTEILPMSVRTRFFDEATNRANRPYMPGWRTHSPEEIAEAIWRAVRRPVPEVYSSTMARLVLALDAISPGILDALILARRKSSPRPE